MALAKRALLDTSALIATLHLGHPGHDWASEQRQRAAEFLISSHTLAEAYKVLTVHPHIRLPPDTARQLLSKVQEKVDSVSLTETDYAAALARCAAQGLAGAVVFDALVAQAALKAGAEALVTLNPKDFQRLGADVRALVVSP